MARKPKTRVVATINDVVVELFSILERPDGTLLIAPRSQSHVDLPGENSTRALHEQHFSVHESKQGQDTSVTFKQTLADGTTVDNVAYIPGTQHQLLWPLFARRVGVSPTTFTRQPPDRKSDRLINVAAYYRESSNLFFSAFVVRKDHPRPSHDSAVTVCRVEFPRYHVLVLTCFINIPSIPDGDLVFNATSDVVYNKQITENHGRFEVASLPPDELYARHWLLVAWLNAKFRTRVPSLNEHPLEQRELFAYLSSEFTAEPIVKVPISSNVAEVDR